MHARELHQFPDPTAIGLFVAVHAAILAFGLRIKGATRQSLLRVVEQVSALVAYARLLGSVVVVAVHLDELGDHPGLLFLVQHYQFVPRLKTYLPVAPWAA